MKKIKIHCTGSRTVPYTDLKPFQGNLKEMSTESAVKLRASIERWGWRYPVFVWREGKTDWIHDGHGRLQVLKSMIVEGYTIDEIPVVDIQAKNKKEAGQLLLAVNSKYQSITDEGLYEFINEMEIDSIDLDMFDLPDIDMETFKAGYLEDVAKEESGDEKEYKTVYEVAVTCKDEKEQQKVFALLTERGYSCRVLIL